MAIFDKRCPKCNLPVSGKTDVTSFNPSVGSTAQCQHCLTVVGLKIEKTDVGELASYYTLSDEVVQAVREFASKHGPRWRAKLRHLWNTGLDSGLLRRVRNEIGPSGIDKVKV